MSNCFENNRKIHQPMVSLRKPMVSLPAMLLVIGLVMVSDSITLSDTIAYRFGEKKSQFEKF